MIIRYGNRTYVYAGFLREEYPPLTFETDAPADPGSYPPVRTGFGPVFENRNRLTVGFRIILVIPQVIVLAVFVVALVAWVIALFAVLFTGRWPEGLRGFVVGVMCWGTRVSAYSSCSPTRTRRSAWNERGTRWRGSVREARRRHRCRRRCRLLGCRPWRWRWLGRRGRPLRSPRMS